MRDEPGAESPLALSNLAYFFVFTSEFFDFPAQLFDIFFEPGSKFSSNYSFTAMTSIFPIFFATIQVSAIEAIFFFTNIATAHIIIFSIKAIFTMLFVAIFPYACHKWQAPFTLGFVAAFTCVYAKFTYIPLTASTLSQLPTLLAYAIVALVARLKVRSTRRTEISLALGAASQSLIYQMILTKVFNAFTASMIRQTIPFTTVSVPFYIFFLVILKNHITLRTVESTLIHHLVVFFEKPPKLSTCTLTPICRKLNMLQ